MQIEPRSQFKNNSAGVIGVTIYDEDGRRQGLAVKPGESIMLTKRDEIATANAPKLEKDNPFMNGLDLVAVAEDMENARPIGSTMERPAPAPEAEAADDDLPPEGTLPREERPPVEDSLTPPLPPGDPEHGIRAPDEEVGSPEVVAKAGTQQRTGRGTTVKSGNAAAKPAPEGATGVVVAVGGTSTTQE